MHCFMALCQFFTRCCKNKSRDIRIHMQILYT